MNHLQAWRAGLIEAIDRSVRVLKVHRPYHQSDHVLDYSVQRVERWELSGRH